MKADLHCHSLYSDGELEVAELLALAEERGLTHLALTDHDCVDGSVLALSLPHNLKIIHGIELSTKWQGESVHILGFFPTLEQFLALKPQLAKMTAERKRRAYRIAEKLASEFGIELDTQFIEENPSVTRGRIMAEIIAQGYPYTQTEIFARMIGDGCPAFYPASHLPTPEGIEFIHAHGGLAVLAHPMLLKKVDPEAIVAMGIDGIEARYGAQLALEPVYRALAERHGLLVTSGSDFHRFVDSVHSPLGSCYLEGEDLAKFLERLYG